MGARQEKTAVVDKIRASLEGATATVLTEYRGLSVPEMAQLREQLRQTGGAYSVAKNTLIRRAAANAGLSIPDEVLTGPTALAYTTEDIAGSAKALRAFAKDHPALVIKGAILEGNFIDAAAAGDLADLETQDELLSSFVGMYESMLAYMVRMSDDLLTETVGLMTALADKKPA